MHRVGLAGLRRAKQDDGSVFTFNKRLHCSLDTLLVEFVLSLPFAEDVIEVEDISIVTLSAT